MCTIFLDLIISGEMKDGMFKCMELNSQGLYAGGSDGILREINVNTNKIRISEVYIMFKIFIDLANSK